MKILQQMAQPGGDVMVRLNATGTLEPQDIKIRYLPNHHYEL